MHYILQSRFSLCSLRRLWWIHLDPASNISAISATSLGMLQLIKRAPGYLKHKRQLQITAIKLLSMRYLNPALQLDRTESGIQNYIYTILRKIMYTVKPLFIVFVRGLKKKQWIWENNRCGSHSWNRIHSGTIEIERQIRENEFSGNDR
jgi:hypothetical protein